MNHNVITTRELTKFYGTSRGIEGLNLQVKEGEIFGFLGPNGAGKTTTLRLLLDFIRPTSGHIELFGRDLKREKKTLLPRVGNVPGEVTLYGNLTGIQFLRHMNGFTGKPPILQEELIDAFQLSPQDLGKKIKSYSHGMKQKLIIIQAMQEAPDLLIMDEPTEGLDPLNQNTLYDYLIKQKEKGKTILFSSHNLSEVEKICDRVGLIRSGTLIAVESLESLKQKMVRKMKVSFKAKVPEEEFSSAKIIEKGKDTVTLEVSGDINSLLRELATHDIENIIFPEATLEDTFLSYYREEGGGTQS